MAEFRKMLLPPDLEFLVSSLSEKAIEKMQEQNVFPIIETQQLMGTRYQDDFDEAYSKNIEQVYIGDYMLRVLFRDARFKEGIHARTNIFALEKMLGDLLYLVETGRYHDAKDELQKAQKSLMVSEGKMSLGIAAARYIYDEMAFSVGILDYLNDTLPAGEISLQIYAQRGRGALELMDRRYN